MLCRVWFWLEPPLLAFVGDGVTALAALAVSLPPEYAARDVPSSVSSSCVLDLRSIASRHRSHATAEHARLRDFPVPVGDSSMTMEALRFLLFLLFFWSLFEAPIGVPVAPPLLFEPLLLFSSASASASSLIRRHRSSASISATCCGYGSAYGKGTVRPVGKGGGGGAAVHVLEWSWSSSLLLDLGFDMLQCRFV